MVSIDIRRALAVGGSHGGDVLLQYDLFLGCCSAAAAPEVQEAAQYEHQQHRDYRDDDDGGLVNRRLHLGLMD